MSTTSAPLSGPAASLAADTTVGTVALTVSDLRRARAFYEEILGLPVHELADGDLALGPDQVTPVVTLRGDRNAAPRDPHAPGLFHLALLFPSRRDLAHALLRVARARWPLNGASDHLVSEALYLSDPDGNGIELYRDRPRAQWPTDDAGRLQMATLALDLRDLIGEAGAADERDRWAPAGIRMGHVHLQVSDLPQARAFYHGILGFDVVIDQYPGALFVSAGGYHHHVGLNIWNSARSAPAKPGSVGLRRFEIVVPDLAELDRVRRRVTDAGLQSEPPTGDGAGSFLVDDPFGTPVLLRAA